MRVRRVKPYVCVDCDYAEHFRFQDTKDVDAAAGTWLRCLAHSRAQEQDGIVRTAWLRRTFATTYERVEELIAVGLLRARGDGDYEIHAYAPRNQTRAMLRDGLTDARERMAATRAAAGTSKGRRAPQDGSEQGPNKRRSSDTKQGDVRPNMDRTTDDVDPRDADGEHRRAVSKPPFGRVVEIQSRALVAPFEPSSTASGGDIAVENDNPSETFESDKCAPQHGPSERANKDRTSALVPTSTSTSTSLSTSSASLVSVHKGSENHSGGPAGPAEYGRTPLPASERGLSGALWLQAFTDGVTDQTHRPCTAGRVFLGTLERLVTHHAPQRDVAAACTWLREQARAFAAQWDGKHPAKGLTPDGLERWLNDGRQGPPEFGRPRIVQPAAEDWHEDDWSDLGAEVVQ